jgi:hypothetical protein
MSAVRKPWLILTGAIVALAAGIGACVVALVLLVHTVG